MPTPQLSVINSSGPGSLGLNKEEPAVNLPLEYCLSAWNCVIETDGRLTSRKALIQIPNTEEGEEDITVVGPSEPVKSMYETIKPDGVSDIVLGTTTMLFQYTPSTDTYVALPITPYSAPTNGEWQFQAMKDKLLCTQAEHDVMAYVRDGVTQNWTTTGATYTAPTGLAAEQFTICHAAYGRMFLGGGPSNPKKIFWSPVLEPLTFTGTGSGSLDLSEVFTNGQDEVVAIATHSGFLVFLCKKQTVVFALPEDRDPAYMSLVEVINDVGCTSKWSVASVGEDLVWAAKQGMVSLGRLLQQKSMPYGNISRRVHFDFLQTQQVAGQGALKSVFMQDSENLLVFHSATGCWCFNVRKTNPGDPAIATRWDQFPGNIYCGVFTNDGDTIFGGDGALYRYSTYGDSLNPYTIRYYSGYMDFGSPNTIKFLKKFAYVLRGASNQTVTFKWAFDYNTNYAGATDTIGEGATVAEYNEAEYGEDEYSSGESIEEVRVNATRSGKVLQIGVEAIINGDPVGIYSVAAYVTGGKTY
jgi:hypothetical protein